MLAALIFDRGLDALGDTVVEVGAADPNARLNIMAANGSRMLATTWGDTLSILRRADGVVLASEPYDDDPDWQEVPDRHLVDVVGLPHRPDSPERTVMTLSLSNYLAADSAAQALRRDVRDGLTQTPKSLPPKWFYDSVGSDLFDQITRLPEYYPTRAEAEILRARAADIVAASGRGHPGRTRQRHVREDADRCWTRCATADHCAGSFRSTSTRVCSTAAGAAIGAEYPGVEIDAVCGDFEEHLGKIPAVGRRLVIFLGSTIGNLTPGPRAAVPRRACPTRLQPGDTLLLGTDLVKDVDRLVRAYDDAAGVTALFNKNVLAVVNRELDADFDLDGVRARRPWNADEERIEMWLRAGTSAACARRRTWT